MANVASGTYEVDPISRIEGHLGVKVTTDGSTITEADAHGNLWRGFENFLIGRDANDPITVTQRICGVCPVPHGLAATFAADSVLGISDGYATFSTLAISGKGVPPKAVLIRNLVLGCEFLMSSITHFYHLAALSYVQGPPIPPWTPYFNDNQYHGALLGKKHGIQPSGAASTATEYGVLPRNGVTGTYGTTGLSTDLWSAVIKQYIKALRIRRLTFEAGALFAGRMPMTSCFVAGGVTNSFRDAADFNNRCDTFRTLMVEVGNFVVEEYIPLVLALGALYPDFDSSKAAVPANGFGAGLGNYLAWGGFPAADATGTLAMPGGIWTGGVAGSKTTTLLTDASNLAASITAVKTHLVEVITRSRYENTYGYNTSEFAYPGDVTRTEPRRDAATKYSWMKAPRWHDAGTGGTVTFVGAGPDAAGVTVTLGAEETNVRLAAGVKGVDYSVTYLGTNQWSFKRLTATIPAGAVTVLSDVFTALEVGPMARMVVSGKYPLGKLVADPTGISGPISQAYGELYTTGGNLDTTVISPDLVAGLQNDNTLGAGNGASSLLPTVQTHILTKKCGLSTIDRLTARALESFWISTWMLGDYVKGSGFPTTGTKGWLFDLRALGYAAPGFVVVAPPASASGFGLVEAPRGALGHFSSQTAGKITAYQCVVPTTWNGSPKDGADAADTFSLRNATNTAQTKRGAIEQAMIGATFDAGLASNGAVSGVEVLRIAQSFDPCIACAVH